MPRNVPQPLASLPRQRQRPRGAAQVADVEARVVGHEHGGLPVQANPIRNFRPDIVHLASPFVLGGSGAFAARQLRIPAIAVYQTDVAGFAHKYHLAPLAAASWEWTRTIHAVDRKSVV